MISVSKVDFRIF